MSKLDAIAAVFRRARGRWVALPELLQVAPAQHTKRISDLRRAGWVITCADKYVQRGTAWERQTAYRCEVVGK